MAFNEYKPGSAFPGVIGRTTDESTPAWPQPLRASPGAPNVVMIVLDDTGFGHLGCYGSPIATPNLDRLAADGLLYNNMHTTALCSPSRSCIVTGRNHHANGMAAITELATGYPGYDGLIPFENGMLSEILSQHGLQHLHGRQVAPDALGAGVRGRALRPMAARPSLRPVLRLPRGRHQPVVSGAGLRQPSGRAAGNARGGLPPDRRPGRPCDQLHCRREAGGPGQAVLPALLPRCHARSAPRGQGVGGPVHGPVRRRLGRLPGARLHPAEGARDRSAPTRSCPGTTRTYRSGTRCRRTPAGSPPG